MSASATAVVDELMQSIVRETVPISLHSKIEQHQSHLHTKAITLIDGGISGELARQIVSSVLDSFKEELLRTIKALQESGDAY